MRRKWGEASNEVSIGFAWLPTRVKTHCTGIWHYKWIWLKEYEYQTVLYTSTNNWVKDKFRRRNNEIN